MRADDVREFLSVPWDRLEERRRQLWADVDRARGPARATAICGALREAIRSANPDWPSAEERASDFDDHGQMKVRLDRAAQAIATRAPD